MTVQTRNCIFRTMMRKSKRKSYIQLLTALLLSLNAMMLHAQQDADTVDIETVGNYITMPVTLNGKPMRFILDTGCGANVVFRHAVDNTVQVTADGDSIESSTGRTEAAEKMMGCLKVCKYDGDDTVPLYVATVDSIMMLRGDGIVGMQYILERDGMNMKIDVQGKQVIFTRDKHMFDKEEGRKYRTRQTDKRLAIKTKVSPGIKIKDVVIDTGCDHLFSMNSADLEAIMNGKHRERFAHQVQGLKASGMGGMFGLAEESVTALRLEELTVEGLRFHDVDVETGRESLLGFPFLQTASVVFYHKGKRIKVEPYTATQDYRIVRQEEKVKQGGYTMTYNKETVVEHYISGKK